MKVDRSFQCHTCGAEVDGECGVFYIANFGGEDCCEACIKEVYQDWCKEYYRDWLSEYLSNHPDEDIDDDIFEDYTDWCNEHCDDWVVENYDRIDLSVDGDDYWYDSFGED